MVAVAAVMAVRTTAVMVVATGEASRTEGARAVVTTAAVVAMNPEAVEAGVAWVEVTVVASINLVALRTKDHVMI